MHIPDGYLSLQTSLPVLGTMVPIWSVAFNKVKKAFDLKQIPLLSLCAAFSFVIMMFNVPLGGSSVHAVGAVFIAILLGPWAACIAVSIALIIQALIFGDGGILAIGVNCFNMAFLMPFAGYAVFKLIAGSSERLSKRYMTGIFLGSFIGINVAALFAAVEFGIQPLLFKTAGGQPLYGFYPLAVSVPAIMFEHLLIAGPVEAIITASIIVYLVKFCPQIFDINYQITASTYEKASVFKRYKAFFIALGLMVLLTPLGLIATGTAWGEWGTDEIKGFLGYVPKGLEKLSTFWSSLIPDYSITGFNNGFFQSSVGYIISAVTGIGVIVGVMLISSKLLIKKGDQK